MNTFDIVSLQRSKVFSSNLIPSLCSQFVPIFVFNFIPSSDLFSNVYQYLFPYLFPCLFANCFHICIDNVSPQFFSILLFSIWFHICFLFVSYLFANCFFIYFVKGFFSSEKRTNFPLNSFQFFCFASVLPGIRKGQVVNMNIKTNFFLTL